MANPALEQVPGSVGRPHVVLCGLAQQDDASGVLFLSRSCRVGVSPVGLLSAAGLPADIFPPNWGPKAPAPSGAMDLLSCLRVFVGFELLTLLSAAGMGRFLCQTSPLAWHS